MGGVCRFPLAKQPGASGRWKYVFTGKENRMAGSSRHPVRPPGIAILVEWSGFFCLHHSVFFSGYPRAAFDKRNLSFGLPDTAPNSLHKIMIPHCIAA
jgi:hypothetical protein